MSNVELIHGGINAPHSSRMGGRRWQKDDKEKIELAKAKAKHSLTLIKKEPQGKMNNVHKVAKLKVHVKNPPRPSSQNGKGDKDFKTTHITYCEKWEIDTFLRKQLDKFTPIKGWWNNEPFNVKEGKIEWL